MTRTIRNPRNATRKLKAIRRAARGPTAPRRPKDRPKITKARLVPIGDIRPSTYNPREADAERLEMLETSLRRLGFLLPVFADPQGEILSGHQRHLVATRIGLTHVPVVRVKPMSEQDRKSFNIVFNRATNDLSARDDERMITERLRALDLEALAAAVPEKDPGTSEIFPCIKRLRFHPLRPILRANAGRWNDHARTLSRTLNAKGVAMPVILGPDLQVVNGIGRIEMWAEDKLDFAAVVNVTEAEAELAAALLNLLSMDFDLENRYADVLRHSAHRRQRQKTSSLGDGYKSEVVRSGQDFDPRSPVHQEAWRKAYGTTVADLGAGFLNHTKILRSMGIKVSAFEPFKPARSGVDIPGSRNVCAKFLSDIEDGRAFNSIFLAFVLNSVPFLEDRRKLLRIAAALCHPETRVYVTIKTVDHSAWQTTSGTDYASAAYRSRTNFRLRYESGVTLGDYGKGAPKMQKYHTPKEFSDLMCEHFGNVTIKRYGSAQLVAVCRDPIQVSQEKLREALDFEFDLPYPDGSRLGLAQRARDAFSKRMST